MYKLCKLNNTKKLLKISNLGLINVLNTELDVNVRLLEIVKLRYLSNLAVMQI